MIALAVMLIALAIMLIPASFIIRKKLSELKSFIPHITIVISHK